MLKNRDVTLAYEDLRAFGLDWPEYLMRPDGFADRVSGCMRLMEPYAVEPAELSAAVRAYMTQPVTHGGRRPWPDAGMLLAAVLDLRAKAIPPFGAIEAATRKAINAHFARPALGFVLDEVPEAARDLLAEALVSQRVAHRGGDQPEYVMRDLERAYTERRDRKGRA